MKRQTAIILLGKVMFLAVCLTGGKTQACTIGIANGTATTDGRPILFKNRDSKKLQQRLDYFSNSEWAHSYLGVYSKGGKPTMGVNSAGLVSGNSQARLRDIAEGPYQNGAIQRHILSRFSTVAEVQAFLERQLQYLPDEPDPFHFSGNFPFMDPSGAVIMYESFKPTNIPGWLRIYDTADPARSEQGYEGIVVRANEFHQRDDGLDRLTIEGRYETARHNVLGLHSLGLLNAATIIQGNDGSKGYEFLRYGPDRTYERIARPTTVSSIIVHGVKPDEDPDLTTMWVILGNADFSIAVPSWVRMGDRVAESLKKGLIWDRSDELYSKDNQDVTQASTFPAETQLFNMVNNVLLPHWRENGVPSPEEMGRVHQQMAADAYSLLTCLSQTRDNNKAPVISEIKVSYGKETAANFSVSAHDPDGKVVSYTWNFGDGNTSSEPAPGHTYQQSGTYLVSCTVKDNEDVTITSWNYVTVPGRGGFLNFDWLREMFRPGSREI